MEMQKHSGGPLVLSRPTVRSVSASHVCVCVCLSACLSVCPWCCCSFSSPHSRHTTDSLRSPGHITALAHYSPTQSLSSLFRRLMLMCKPEPKKQQLRFIMILLSWLIKCVARGFVEKRTSSWYVEIVWGQTPPPPSTITPAIYGDIRCALAANYTMLLENIFPFHFHKTIICVAVLFLSFSLLSLHQMGFAHSLLPSSTFNIQLQRIVILPIGSPVRFFFICVNTTGSGSGSGSHTKHRTFESVCARATRATTMCACRFIFINFD